MKRHPHLSFSASLLFGCVCLAPAAASLAQGGPLPAGSSESPAAAHSTQTGRPPITGISHMCVYATDMAASEHFYTHVLGGAKALDPQSPDGRRYYFSPAQFVEVLPLPAGHTGPGRMACVAFSTPDAKGLLQSLNGAGFARGRTLHTDSDGSHWFTADDPEGNTVEFLEPPAGPPAPAVTAALADAHPVGTHVIHVGYLVHDAALEDRFFRQALGFRPYWYGAMKADHVDWISQQVPDGRDWLEYMVVGGKSDVPENVDQHELGVLNHFSIGVPNMEQAVTTMFRDQRLSPQHDGPQMGRDGKWQANFYDPDGTRVELMEFKPVVAPCCSAFTAESGGH